MEKESEMAEIYYLPVPNELTEEQKQHWWETLESAERQREYAMRMLGIIAVEKGLSELDERLYDGRYVNESLYGEDE